MSGESVIKHLDEVVDDFARTVPFFYEPLTRGRAITFVEQHRLNTRQRNTVLKLRVATNCPDWEVRTSILKGCTQEAIADSEYGGGKAHWEILQELGTYIDLELSEIQTAEPLKSTRLCWLAWDSLMSNTHWLEGLIANTCAERVNVPGYGLGLVREKGWFGMERERWRQLFSLTDEQLDFFSLHTEADIEHSDLGWNTVAKHATNLGMEDAVVEACRLNLVVWGQYLQGIADYGDLRD